MVSSCRSQQTTGTAQQGEAFLPGLKSALNDIETVVVTGAGDDVIATLVRDTAGWKVQEAGRYAADIAKIRQNLVALADAKIIETKTTKPELYAAARCRECFERRCHRADDSPSPGRTIPPT